MKTLMLFANDDVDDCKNCIASGLNVDYGDNNEEDVSDLLASRLNKGNSDDLDTGDYDYDVDGDDVDDKYGNNLLDDDHDYGVNGDDVDVKDGTNLLAATLKSSKGSCFPLLALRLSLSLQQKLLMIFIFYLANIL